LNIQGILDISIFDVFLCIFMFSHSGYDSGTT